ncbi:MAG: phosphotransferase family protein [Aliidiomarina sp.]|uniref:phosphotransferase family protein n=1 Tax=Aliidiomarina sp. TaxID=1872439 RepID=UPI0025BAF528|nr:phosphotransferase family protein [Aliidiomarina sp.]MCH8501198.1 phosphotransferase family protein [Aliidiomarina sp.]
MSSDIIAVRPDEALDEERLFAWLQKQDLAGVTERPHITQFGGGKANLTYLLTFPDVSYVLRRPPFGPIAKGAHDMAREFKVLSRLYKAFPQAPRAFVFCDVLEVLGAEFFIMEYRQGVVVRMEIPECYAEITDAPQRMSQALVDALADFHNVTPSSVGLDTLGKPEGFLSRQIHGWFKRWNACTTAADSRMDSLFQWLCEHEPKSQRMTLVHNDFKLDNVMLSPSDPSQLTSVFDWDMCTIGDPLSDLGTLLTYWRHEADDPKYARLAMIPADSRFPSRQYLIRQYAERTGLNVEQVNFYHILGLYRLAVILEQIFARYHHGHTQDERFAEFGELSRLALDWATEIMRMES